MKRIMRIHRYLSCFVAPAMLFFAISGAWQAFRLHEDERQGSYRAPRALAVLSDVHKAEHLQGLPGTWWRIGQLAFAAGFVATAGIGLYMAFRLARPNWLVWVWLLAGILLPTFLAVASHSQPEPHRKPAMERATHDDDDD
ncbi:MAG TPA: hypothetical protein VMM92_08275 [Thermoanaerobaculia bacterium]|nr:hypothetical protein [Thermoanaerobaculia bacterium]